MQRLVGKWMLKLMRLPSCEEISELAYAYLEGHLDPALAAKFERHLRNCANCKRFIDSYRQIATAKLARKIPLDPEFQKRIVAFLKENYQ